MHSNNASPVKMVRIGLGRTDAKEGFHSNNASPAQMVRIGTDTKE